MSRPAIRLARAFGIERGEEGVLLWSAVALFLMSWASISVANVADTLFLKRVGIDRLPYVFLLNVKADVEDLRLLKITLAEAKAGWHAFTVETPAMKAGRSFDEAVKIKDNLSKKLGHD